jgi:5-methylcytosine-specific restriction endonuclease McrA
MPNEQSHYIKEQYPHQRIYERDDFKCRYCGWDGKESFQKFFVANLGVDHIKPIYAGGTDDDSNLVLACHACNLYKGKQDCSNFEEAREFVFNKRKEAENWYSRFVLSANKNK